MERDREGLREREREGGRPECRAAEAGAGLEGRKEGKAKDGYSSFLPSGDAVAAPTKKCKCDSSPKAVAASTGKATFCAQDDAEVGAQVRL